MKTYPYNHALLSHTQICEAFGANRYPFPEDASKQAPMLSEINGRIRELSSTIEAGHKQKQSLLKEVATNLPDWGTMVSGTQMSREAGFPIAC